MTPAASCSFADTHFYESFVVCCRYFTGRCAVFLPMGPSCICQASNPAGRVLQRATFCPYNAACCGCSSMVERQLPKLHTRVRFPSPAPDSCLTWPQATSEPADLLLAAGFLLSHAVWGLTGAKHGFWNHRVKVRATPQNAVRNHDAQKSHSNRTASAASMTLLRVALQCQRWRVASIP